MKKLLRSKRGSVLLVALAIATVVAIALSSHLQMARTAMQISQRSFLANDAMNVAEASLEQTLWSFNQSNAGNGSAWSNWSAGNANTTDDKQRAFTTSDFTLSQGATATAKVYVKNFNSSGFPPPVAIAKATVNIPNSKPIVKEIEIYLMRRSFFSTGLVAKNGVTFSGQNATVDSWNSDPELDGLNLIPYSPSVRQAHGSVATTSISATVDVQNADIFGYVSVGSANESAITLGTGGKISGDFNAANGTRDESRIATNFTADLPDQSEPSGVTWKVYKEPGNNNYITGAGKCTLPENGDQNGTSAVLSLDGKTLTMYYTVQYINLTGNSANQLTIRENPDLNLAATPPKPHWKVVIRTTVAAGNDGVKTAGSAGIEIQTGGELAIYTAGNVDVTGSSSNGSGGGLLNTGSASAFQIWGTATAAQTQTIKIAGVGSLSGIVYAPNADVSIVGNGDVYGAVVGKTVKVTGNANFHYDESLAAFGANNPFKVSSWRELRTPAEQATYSTIMGAF